jgi:hypothetical protein
MASNLETAAGRSAYLSCQSLLQKCCDLVEQLNFAEALVPVEEASVLHEAAFAAHTDDLALRELYALGQFIQFFRAYVRLWRQLIDGEFTATWNALQDSLDHLRGTKRFSGIDISFFESQLLGLESTYPYRLFASIGAVADFTECSICGKDIEGFECTHRRGELYAGKLAVGIVRGLRLQEVSLVTNPVDKRCIMQVQGTEYAFPALEFIREEVLSGRLKIGWIEVFEWSECEVPIAKQPRNAQCACGSGRKFKHCCRQKPMETRKHVEVVPRPRLLRDAVA